MSARKTPVARRVGGRRKASPRRARTAPRKHWSFLAYIAGDNNLSDNGLEDIEELCQTGASPQVHAAVQIDTLGEHDGSVRYEITEPDWENQAHRVVIQRLSESDSGNPLVLKNFLLWGFQRYPAEKRLVVVWNHGSGFRDVRRDIGYDDFGSSMDMPEVAEALRRAGVRPARKLAVLGFDACLMNMLEITHHFAPQAEVIVGSQQTEPGDGWPYDEVLALLHANPTPKALGRAIVDAYIASNRRAGMLNVTQSAVELAKTEAAVRRFGRLGTRLLAELPEAKSGIREARMKAQAYEFADFVDLVDLTELLEEHVPACTDEAVACRDAAAAAVIHSDYYGAPVRNSHGLSVWFPATQAQYVEYRAQYMQLRCNIGGSGWVRFLDAYFGV